jgi:hypothetical protein
MSHSFPQIIACLGDKSCPVVEEALHVLNSVFDIGDFEDCNSAINNNALYLLCELLDQSRGPKILITVIGVIDRILTFGG